MVIPALLRNANHQFSPFGTFGARVGNEPKDRDLSVFMVSVLIKTEKARRVPSLQGLSQGLPFNVARDA